MSTTLKSPRLKKIDIAEIKALEMAEDSVMRMNPSGKRKILIGLFEKYRPGEPSPLKAQKNEYILRADIEEKLEELSLRKDVPKGKSALFEKHIFEQLWKEHQAGEEKNKEANRESLRNETNRKIKDLLEQKQEGKVISDEQNAAAILEQLEGNQIIKNHVRELLKQQFEKGYKARKPKNAEAEVEKAKQVVYRLLTMRNGKVARLVHQELSPQEKPKKDKVKPKESNSYNYTHLKTEVEEFQKDISDLQLESASDMTMLQMEMEGQDKSPTEIEKSLEELAKHHQKDKLRVVKKMEEYLEGAYKKYQQDDVPFEKRVSLGKSLFLLRGSMGKMGVSSEKMEKISFDFLSQIRKDNERHESRSKSSGIIVKLPNPLNKAA